MGRRNGFELRASALVGAVLGLAVGCSGAPDVSLQPGSALTHETQGDPRLLGAVATYKADGELGPLQKWLAENPDDPDAEYWREVVALRMYQSLALGDPFGDPHPELGDDPALEPLPTPSLAQLGVLAATYPRTLGGRTAAAHLDGESLRQLRQPRLNSRAAAFLTGDDALLEGTGLDPTEFRARHEESLRHEFSRVLLSTGCAKEMGYCNWWVASFPSDAATAEVERAVANVWKQRAHPPWRSKGYATCTLRCARSCRAQAAPLDDACYDPCFANC